MTTKSQPTTGDLVELVTALQKLGAVQVVYGDFQCTLEPGGPPFAGLALDSEDELLTETRAAGKYRKKTTQKAMSEADIAAKRRQIEAELYAAAEGDGE